MRMVKKGDEGKQVMFKMGARGAYRYGTLIEVTAMNAKVHGEDGQVYVTYPDRCWCD